MQAQPQPQQKPSLNLNSIIQAVQQQQEVATDENKRLHQILAIQKTLMEKQRKYLLDIATTTKELLEVELKRKALKEKLASQKTALLIAASEAQETQNIVGEVIQAAPDAPPISSTESGQFAAKIVDAISSQVFEMTEQCLKSQDLSISSTDIQSAIISINQLIQKVIDAGIATESPEDTIRRQSYAISSLVSTPEEE